MSYSMALALAILKTAHAYFPIHYTPLMRNEAQYQQAQYNPAGGYPSFMPPYAEYPSGNVQGEPNSYIPSYVPIEGNFIIQSSGDYNPSPNTPSQGPEQPHPSTEIKKPNNSSGDYEAKALLDAVNGERKNLNLPEYTMNEKLNKAAQKHSKYQSDKNICSHTGEGGSSPSKRCEAEGYGQCAENVAQVMDGWMKSQGHKDNILDVKYKEFGAARVGNAWTQNFGFGESNARSPQEVYPLDALGKSQYESSGKGTYNNTLPSYNTYSPQSTYTPVSNTYSSAMYDILY